MIGIEEFDKVDMRAGTILEAKENKKSRNPAYVITIDFGEEIGIKKSSAQITTLYQTDDLVGMQVICCVNLTPMHIGSVKSEVRILGTESEQGGGFAETDRESEKWRQGLLSNFIPPLWFLRFRSGGVFLCFDTLTIYSSADLCYYFRKKR